MAANESSDSDAFGRQGREGLGICLSGGGLRAALFHLGALRRLHELGVLQRARWISAVSGGSILAAHLAQCQVDRGRAGRPDFADWQRDVSDPFRAFAARDLRTWPVIRNAAWNWLWPEPLLRQLEARLRARLTRLALRDLPARPEYIFCATDLTFGVNWEFSRRRVGSYEAGYLDLTRPSPEARRLCVARAVTASACWPPLFGPMRAGIPPAQLVGGRYAGTDDALRRRLVLSDGGLYDNMATEPVWKQAATVLVSDCGAPFPYEPEREPWRTWLRYPSVLARQTQSLRIRILESVWRAPESERAYDGTRWHIARGIPDGGDHLPGDIGYPASLARETIARVRTDLDAFTPAEMSVLENHGYCCADYRIRRDLPALGGATARPAAAPYPSYLEPAVAVAALRDSDRRFTLRRILLDLYNSY